MTANTYIAEGERLLRLPEVLKIIPVSRSEWYRRLSAGDAPAAVELGPRARAWRLSDVHDYLLRIAARDRSQVRLARSSDSAKSEAGNR